MLLLWHMLFLTSVSLVVPAKANALFPLFLPEMASTSLMRIPASSAAPVLAFAQLTLPSRADFPYIRGPEKRGFVHRTGPFSLDREIDGIPGTQKESACIRLGIQTPGLSKNPAGFDVIKIIFYCRSYGRSDDYRSSPRRSSQSRR